ncbi:hypothetical protein D918_10176 [Trichuris suis]|nr:hypothetical protein D918_10176 [Trichuris suis]
MPLGMAEPRLPSESRRIGPWGPRDHASRARAWEPPWASPHPSPSRCLSQRTPRAAACAGGSARALAPSGGHRLQLQRAWPLACLSQPHPGVCAGPRQQRSGRGPSSSPPACTEEMHDRGWQDCLHGTLQLPEGQEPALGVETAGAESTSTPQPGDPAQTQRPPRRNAGQPHRGRVLGPCVPRRGGRGSGGREDTAVEPWREQGHGGEHSPAPESHRGDPLPSKPEAQRWEANPLAWVRSCASEASKGAPTPDSLPNSPAPGPPDRAGSEPPKPRQNAFPRRSGEANGAKAPQAPRVQRQRPGHPLGVPATPPQAHR